jgi:hypothetical protein
MAQAPAIPATNPFLITAAYVALIVLLMVFFVVLSVIWSDSKYIPEWIPDASKTTLDLIKVVVGAIVGTLTPSAVNAARRAR